MFYHYLQGLKAEIQQSKAVGRQHSRKNSFSATDCPQAKPPRFNPIVPFMCAALILASVSAGYLIVVAVALAVGR
jgi:hypothetical protein